MNGWDLILIVAFTAMGVVAIWFPLMILAVLFSGWWDLAKRFPKRPPADVYKRGVGSVFFSPIFRYRGVVSYAADHDHLHLSLPLVGVFHEPISIPFAELRFFAGDRKVMGLTPVEVDGRRMLLSRAMIQREALVRRELGTLDESAERELFPADADHNDTPPHDSHENTNEHPHDDPARQQPSTTRREPISAPPTDPR